MGCTSSRENDKNAAGTRGVGERYEEMAEDAASMLSGAGMRNFFVRTTQKQVVNRLQTASRVRESPVGVQAASITSLYRSSYPNS